MADFKITDERIDFICGRLNITKIADKQMVKDLYRDFSYFYDNRVKTLHLAPVIMAMERHVRESYNMRNFKITVSPMKNCNTRRGMAFLRWDLNQYNICIPPNGDSITIHNIIAHELGHLFYVVNCLHGKDVPKLKNDGHLADKMADVIGIFTMANRAEFYNSAATNASRKSFQDVVDDFVAMGRGRKHSIDPMSGTSR